MRMLVLDRASTPADRLRVYKRAGDGAWLVEGVTNREGIYLYDEGGRTVRELRTADSVRAMTAKIARAAVTLGHPDVEITPDNVASIAVGDVDAVVDTPEQGGFVVGINRVALRTRDAIERAERGELKGFSPGYVPVRDYTPGVDPKWGPYDRVLVDVAAVNHLALCGDSDDLPPARGGNAICALYLDSLPRSHKMKPNLKSADAKAMIGRVFGKDAVSLEELAKMVEEAMRDPESLAALVVHAIVNKPAEVMEIKTGSEEIEEPDAKPMPSDGYDADKMGEMMDAKIAAALDPIKKSLDMLHGEKAARDAASNATRDAEWRKVAAFHGVRDALPIKDLASKLADRLNVACDASDAGIAFIFGTAARRMTAPTLTLPLSTDSGGELAPAKIGV